MEALYLRIVSLAMFLSVALGAFGAHALKERVEPYYLAVWEKAVLYQMIHGIALILIVLLSKSNAITEETGKKVFILFSLGILIFSGSLYALVLSGVKTLGAFTPIGGILFLIGWAVLIAG